MKTTKPEDTARDLFAMDADEFDTVDATAALAAAEAARRHELASLAPLRADVQEQRPIAIVGVSGHGKEKLAEALNAFGRELRSTRNDDDYDDLDPYKISLVHDVRDVRYLRATDSIIFVVDPTDATSQGEAEEFASALKRIGMPRLMVFVSKLDLVADDHRATKARRDVRDLLGDAGFTPSELSIHFGSARGALRANFSGSSIWTDAFHGLVRSL